MVQYGIGESLQFSGDQKAETAAIAELAITIKADSPDLGEKVDQLQKQDKVFRDLQTQQVFDTLVLFLHCYPCIFDIWMDPYSIGPKQFETQFWKTKDKVQSLGLFASTIYPFQAGLVEKLVSGKIAKQQYIDQVDIDIGSCFGCDLDLEVELDLSGEWGVKEEGGGFG